MSRLIIILSTAVLLVGCEFITEARGISGEGTSYAVTAECSLSTDQRRENLAAVNNSLAERGVVERATALDCDGDGSPDFTLEPE